MRDGETLYRALATEMVQTLLCEGQSSMELSEALGMRTDVVGAWAKGERSPRTSLFFRLLEATGHDVPQKLLAFFGAPPRFLDGRAFKPEVAAMQLLDEFRGTESLREFAQRIDVDRPALARWSCGETEPSLPHLLLVVDRGICRLSDFVSCLVDVKVIPSIVARHAREEQLRQLAYAYPESEAVLRVVEHWSVTSDEVVAALPFGDEERLHAVVQQALHLGVIEADERGRLGLVEPMSINTGRDRELSNRLKDFWVNQLRDLTRDEGVKGYVVFAASDPELRRLEEEVRSFYHRMRKLIRGFEGGENVAALALMTGCFAESKA